MSYDSPETLKFVFGDYPPGMQVEEVARHSQRRFVRGDTQISLFDPGRNATGHILTALEAYRTFGLEKLVEAVDYGTAVILKRRGAIEESLRGRREELGLSVASVAGAARLPHDTVTAAETNAYDIPIQSLESIAFALGLDESRLAFHLASDADQALAVRLRTLQNQSADAYEVGLSAGTVLTLAEAVSIVRVQCQLQETLGIYSRLEEFEPSGNYGSRGNPAWQVGYNLASETRETLGIGNDSIESMRSLVEETLGIPVIQARMPESISGATVAVRTGNGGEFRGIVLNTVGQNRNVWVRRATIAHELGHLLHDSEDRLESVRVDSYDGNERDPEESFRDSSVDYVEQRANAFAIAFLAPNDAIRERVDVPIRGEDVAMVMSTYGVSRTSAQFHISNAWDKQYRLPDAEDIPHRFPSDEQVSAENFSTDYFPLEGTPIQRRGRFAGIVAAGCDTGLISEETAAAYLRCRVDEFLRAKDFIRSIHPLEIP